MNVNLICDDVLKGLAALPNSSVDVVVTSPDYNLGINYKSGRMIRPNKDYLAWAAAWGVEVMRVLKPGGHFFLNVAGAPSRPLLPHHLAILFSDFAVLQNTFHWIKSISLKKTGLYDINQKPVTDISAGHFKPLSSDRFVTDMHEYIFHFTHAGKSKLNRKAIGVPYEDLSNAKRWGHAGGQNLRCRGNTWHVPYKTIVSRSKRPHPATFPPELVLTALKIADVNSSSAVLDIFVGIGNSGIAAAQIGVGTFIGIDKEESYIEEARTRIDLAINNQPN